MPKFIIIQEETFFVRYLVEADTSQGAEEKFCGGDADTIELDTELKDSEIAHVAPLAEELPPTPEMHKIIEAADTADGRIALTITWPNGGETVEIVSEAAAAILGYAYPDETA